MRGDAGERGDAEYVEYADYAGTRERVGDAFEKAPPTPPAKL